MFRTYLKVILPVCVIVVLVITGALYFREEISTGGPGRVNSFHLSKLDGTKVSIEEINFRVLVLNLWASWCAACVNEIPALDRLQKRYADQGLKVVCVSVEPKQTQSELRLFNSGEWKAHEFSVGFFRDADSKLTELFDVHGIPLTIVLDRKLNVLERVLGESTWNTQALYKKFDVWLAEK